MKNLDFGKVLGVLSLIISVSVLFGTCWINRDNDRLEQKVETLEQKNTELMEKDSLYESAIIQINDFSKLTRNAFLVIAGQQKWDLVRVDSILSAKMKAQNISALEAKVKRLEGQIQKKE